MAEVLTEFRFKEYAPRSRRYARWMDGQIYRLRHGEDFFCKLASFEQSVCRVARSFGKRALYTVESEHPLVIVFQAVPRNGGALDTERR